MSVVGIVIGALVVGVTGLVIGLLLGVAAEKFEVEVDERELLVRDALPGNNCGGCGYPGCDGLAKAIVEGNAPVTGCPVASSEIAEQIGKIMGVDADATDRKVAFVKCAGTCDKASVNYNYYGNTDCNMAAVAPSGGSKKCSYGCTGYGSCVKACPFDAIHVVNGVALVDKDKCVACGKCVAECPKNLIELVPHKAKHLVQCNSNNKGKDVKAACSTGCIGCMLCKKVCEDDAITVVNNLAYIDQSKCTGCGKCAEKCPVKIIA